MKNRGLVSALLVFVLFGVPLSLRAQGAPGSLAAHTQAQIALLQDEKASRTPDQEKLECQIVYALRQQKFGAVAPGLTLLKPGLNLENSGLLLVDIQAEVTPDLLQLIKGNGGTVISSFTQYKTIRAAVSFPLIESLSKQAQVQFIRPADQAIANAIPLFGGDIAHTADQARQIFLANGSGIKVGVLSDSVDYLENAQEDGSLGTVTVLPGQAGAGSGEGTAILEIVHSLAPGADLYFATAFGSVGGFAQNIRDLYAAGCRIIVDDVLYLNESPFQDGPIALAVNDVSAGGALFFSSAANGGGINRNTSGTWEGDFVDAGQTTIGRNGRLHNFGGGQTYNTVMPGGSFQRVDLFWADPLGSSSNDYDVYVLDSNGNVIRSSTNIQNGHSDPYESIGLVNTGQRIVIVKQSGQARFLHLSTLRGRLEIATSGSTYGHNASGATNAFSVAAASVPSPTAPFTGGTANAIEAFSSDGPRRIFFNPNGSAITPGDFSSTGGRLLAKPDLTAADGVGTTVPGFGLFFGTSAAAPHAAAIAALLWSYDRSLDPANIRRIMTETSLNLGAPGWDQDSGSGIAMAYASLSDTLPMIQNVHVLDSNNNGSLDANECADLSITLSNRNTGPIDGITAVLTTSVPWVVIDPAPRSFPNLAVGASGVSSTPFRVSTQPGFVCGSNVTFVLHVSTTNHDSFQQSFTLRSITSQAGVPVRFDSTNVPAAIPDQSMVESTLVADDLPLPLAKVKVSVYITHTYDQDLRLSLVGPDGTEALLSANNGFSGQNYGAGCGAPTVFSDSAPTRITSGDAPFVGTFAPEQPLSIFNGKTGAGAAGIWKLRVEDTSQFDVGSVQCWSLELTPISCLDGGGQCLAPPEITQQPQDTVTTNGAAAEFTVVAAGAGPLSYQWYANETTVPPYGTNATLVLSNVTPADAGTYAVVVSNPYGSTTSAVATLTVIVLPTITCGTNRVVELGTAWDFDEPAATGNNVVVTVVNTVTNAACGASYSATRTWVATDTDQYQAFCSQTVQVTDTTPPALTCAGNRSLVYGSAWSFDEPAAQDPSGVAVVVLNTQTNVDCGRGFTAHRTWRATDGCGNIAVCTQTIQVVDENPPVIVTQPASQEVLEGHDAMLEVSILSCPTVGYQWYFNETNLLSEATNATLVLTNVLEEQAGAYIVVVTNNHGMVTSEVAQLTVPVPAQIVSGPQNEVVTSGQSVHLSVVARGTDPLFYQWYFDGTSLFPQGTNTTLLIASITAAQAGNYLVVVTNAYGSVTSAPVLISFAVPPTIISDPTNAVATNGDLVVFSVVAQGSEPFEYLWYFNETNVLSEATNATLVLSNVTPADVGSYAAVVINAYGSRTSASATLTVIVLPTITCGTNRMVELGAAWDFDEPTATGSNVVVTVVDTVTNSACGATYNATRTWAVTDANQYQAFCSQTVQVTDTTAPGLTCAGDRTVVYGSPWTFDEPTAQDPSGVTLEVLSTQTNADCGNGFTAHRAWQATDACGNSSVCTQTVQVVDHDAPVIATQPQDHQILEGHEALLQVGIASCPPLGYQWYFNETNVLSEATNALLTLTNVAEAQGGAYQVVITNPYGSVTSQVAQLTVLVPAAIVSDPTDLLVTNGQPALLSVVARGTETLHYQWYFNQTTPLAQGTGATLLLGSVSPAQAGSYRVVVTNAYGSATSAVAQLNVAVTPLIVSDPTNIVATNGDLVQFSVIVQGSEPLSYHWYFNETNLLAEATNATLVLSNVTPAEAGTYMAAVSNPYGSAASASASLSVIVLPTITCGTNRSVELGAAWDFDEPAATGSNAVVLVVGTVTNAACGATYSATRTWVVTDVNQYQAFCSQTVQIADTTPPDLTCAGNRNVVYGTAWSFDEPTAQDPSDVTLTVLSTQTNAGCGQGFTAHRTWQATDECGNAAVCTQTIQVMDQDPPLIVKQPQSQDVLEHDDTSLHIGIVSCPPDGYQWYFNETNLLAGATNALLSLSNVTEAVVGEYTVVVTNNFGGRTSEIAQVTVLVPAGIVSDPTNRFVTNGQPAEFTVVARGTAPLFYQWYFNQTNLLAGATAAVLTIDTVTPTHAGSYIVVVTNAYGSVTSSPANLTVQGSPMILAQPANQTVHAGGTATFSVSAWGIPAPSYQWLYNSTNILTGENSATLTLTNAQDTRAGHYSVIVSNELGSVLSSQALLTVLNSPAILTQPQNVAAAEGETVLITVQALGKEPLSYQWSADCLRPISGATTATLRLKNVTPANSGTYCVTVSNAFGVVTSDPATLRILVAPKVVSIIRTAGGIELTFTTSLGFLYSVFYKNDLSDAEWIPLPDASQVQATGTTMTLLDSTAPETHRYYEIIVQ